MRNFYLLGLFLFIVGPAISQRDNGNRGPRPEGNGTVSGVVINKATGGPVEYANLVFFSRRDSSMVTGGVTDLEGKFSIKVPFGMYYVTADFIGFTKTTIERLMVTPRNTNPDLGEIEISPSSFNLDQVEVVADKVAYEFKIDKKIVNVSQDLNSASGTIAEVLENTPSVDVDIEGNVTLRGSSNFTVLINGRPSVLSGSDALQQIPARTVKSIEIITNPSAKYDPDGTAGILNIITKKEEEGGLTGLVNVGIGTNDKYSANILLNYRLKKFNVYAGLDFRDDNFDMERTGDRRTTYNDTTTFLESESNRTMSRGGISGKFGFDWYLSDKTTLGVSSRLGSFDFKMQNDGKDHQWVSPGDSSFNYISNGEMKRPRTFYSINTNLTHKFNTKGHQIVGSVFYSGKEGTSEDKTIEWVTDQSWNTLSVLNSINSKEEESSNQLRMNFDYSLPFSDVSKFETGFQSRMETENEDFTFEEFVGNIWVDNNTYSSTSDYTRDIYAAYATFNDEIFGLGYQVGLRGEYTKRIITDQKSNQEYKIDRLDYFPSIHLSKQLPHDIQLMLSYSRRIDRPRGRYLDPFVRYMDINNIWQGNPGLKPEYVNSYEMSFVKKYGSSFFSAEIFYKNTENSITRLLSPQEDGIVLHTVANLNQDHRLGTEMMLSQSIGKKININLNGSVYYYKLEGNAETQDVSKESTNWSSRMTATYKFLPTSRVQLNFRYRGPSATVQGTTEGSLQTSLAIRHDFLKRKASATLQVRDIFGTSKRDFTADLDNFYEHIVMERESQIVQLTLSYRLNNYKPDRSKMQEMQNGGGSSEDVEIEY
jgi:outer membrane receptor protein involved in Fe transport